MSVGDEAHPAGELERVAAVAVALLRGRDPRARVIAARGDQRRPCDRAREDHVGNMTLDRLDAADTRQLAEQMVVAAKQPEVTNLQFVIGLLVIAVALGAFAWLLG